MDTQGSVVERVPVHKHPAPAPPQHCRHLHVGVCRHIDLHRCKPGTRVTALSASAYMLKQQQSHGLQTTREASCT
jgi:hypothetical protein